MTAVVYQIRDYQSPKDIERMQRELEKEAAAILAPSTAVEPCEQIMVTFSESCCGFIEVVPFGGQGIDGMTFTAPDKDLA